ncbi:hypothetical protein LU276_05995 [Moraxella haemolytica]|uniref:hypothetical protein n=1 Tax=Moraxella haemolytica TaxID=2904119 RepID=UPI00254377DE|nr:hypothetical protein [Moraxella sp. ZY171148]WII94582.1 hypothetical protein LU276_05995 [Moraxella sp. ZY171148]
MQKFIIVSLMTSGLLYTSLAHAKKAVETNLGIERYQETYREYTNGERFMQQQGSLNALNGSIKYRFNEKDAIKLEGRYAKGKVDYTGGENPSEENPEGSPYGSIHLKGAPRLSYDIRSLYIYEKSIRPNLSIIGEAGLGYRVLRDLSSRIDSEDYDRKNKTAYTQVGLGAKIALAHGFEFLPRIAYNQGIYGRQYSFLGDHGTITLKQHNARGIEIELPISKQLANQTKISYTPYYRGWNVPTSNTFERIETGEDGSQGIASYSEPENKTKEIGFKLQYTF